MTFNPKATRNLQFTGGTIVQRLHRRDRQPRRPTSAPGNYAATITLTVTNF